jgi:hypothetical protein
MFLRRIVSILRHRDFVSAYEAYAACPTKPWRSQVRRAGSSSRALPEHRWSIRGIKWLQKSVDVCLATSAVPALMPVAALPRQVIRVSLAILWTGCLSRILGGKGLDW